MTSSFSLCGGDLPLAAPGGLPERASNTQRSRRGCWARRLQPGGALNLTAATQSPRDLRRRGDTVAIAISRDVEGSLVHVFCAP
jgi:hypothetical protein